MQSRFIVDDGERHRTICATGETAGQVKPECGAQSVTALQGVPSVPALGEGPKGAAIMLVGEQPGDYEDVAGRPFVGPAGKIMDQALIEAGIDRTQVYVTNAVKHFKWEPRGKRRIHQKPNACEVRACRPWLEAELRIVKPKPVVATGATAAQAIFGPSYQRFVADLRVAVRAAGKELNVIHSRVAASLVLYSATNALRN